MSTGRAVEGQTLSWERVLSHREPEQVPEIAARFEEVGVPIEQVVQVLADAGVSLTEAMLAGEEGWAQPFGGLLAVALLAGEAAALSAHLVTRTSAVRAVAVDALLEDFSAIAVAASLGISRQKVYEIGRNGERLRANGGALG